VLDHAVWREDRSAKDDRSAARVCGCGADDARVRSGRKSAIRAAADRNDDGR